MSRLLTPSPRLSNGLTDAYIDVIGGEPLEENVSGTLSGAVYIVNASKQVVIPPADGGGNVTWIRGVWDDDVTFRYDGFMADLSSDSEGATNYADATAGATASNEYTALDGAHTIIQLAPSAVVGASVQVYYNRRSGQVTLKGQSIAGWPMLHTESNQGTANDGDVYIMMVLAHAYETTGDEKYNTMRNRIGEALLDAGRWVGNELNFDIPLEYEGGTTGLYTYYAPTTTFAWSVIDRPDDAIGNCLQVQATVEEGGPPYNYAGWGAWPSWAISVLEPFNSFDFKIMGDATGRSLQLSSNIDPAKGASGDISALIPMLPSQSGVFAEWSLSQSDFWKTGNVVYDASHKDPSYSGTYGSDVATFTSYEDTANRKLIKQFNFDFTGNESGYAGMYFGPATETSAGTTALKFRFYSAEAGTVDFGATDDAATDFTVTLSVVSGWQDITIPWVGVGGFHSTTFVHPLDQVTIEPNSHVSGTYRVDYMRYDEVVTMADLAPTVFNGFQFGFPSYPIGETPYDVKFANIKINISLIDGTEADPERYMGIPRWTYKWVGYGDNIGYGSWRGPSAVGYNWLAGWTRSGITNPDNGRSLIAMQRHFFQDSQAEYAIQHPLKMEGLFIPRHGRNAWEALNTGGYIAGGYETNTFNKWYQPDNDDWYGYMFRALLSVAGDYYYDPQPESKAILDKWMAWIDVHVIADGGYWWPPSGFQTDGAPRYDYKPIYAYILIAQACIYKYWVDGDALALKWYRLLLDDLFDRRRQTTTGTLAGISRTTEGQNYTTATVVITGDGVGASATAYLAGGKVRYFVVDNPGSGYTTISATVTGDGTGATCSAFLSDRLVGAFSTQHTGWEVFELYNTYAMLVLGSRAGGTINYPITPTANDIAALDGLETYFAANTSATRPSIFNADGLPMHEYDIDSYHNGSGIEGPLTRDTHAKGAMWTETIGPAMYAMFEYGRRHGDYSKFDVLYELVEELAGGLPVTAARGVQVLTDNVFAKGTLTASSTEAGRSVRSLLSYREYQWWKPATTPAYVKVNCAAPEECNYLLISGHNLGTLGATVELRSSDDDFVSTDYLEGLSSPLDDRPILMLFATVAHPDWMLKITTGPASPISLVLLGKSIEIPGRIGGTFDPLGRRFSGMKNINENGQPLGTSYLHETWEEKITINEIPQDWLRDTWLPAWRATIRDNPIAIAWNPELYPDDVQVVVVKGGFESKHQYGLTTDLSFSVIGRYQ